MGFSLTSHTALNISYLNLFSIYSRPVPGNGRVNEWIDNEDYEEENDRFDDGQWNPDKYPSGSGNSPGRPKSNKYIFNYLTLV